MKSLIIKAVCSLVLLSASVAGACEGHDALAGEVKFANGALHANLYWESGPNDGTESVLKIEFVDGATKPVEIKSQLSVKLWMPDMGHGSAPTVVTHVTGAPTQPLIGVYRISNAFFIMPGAWELQITLTNADGSKETQTWNVNVPTASEPSHHH